MPCCIRLCRVLAGRGRRGSGRQAAQGARRRRGGALVHSPGSARLVGRPASVRVRSALAGGGGTLAGRLWRCPRWGELATGIAATSTAGGLPAAARRRLGQRARPEPARHRSSTTHTGVSTLPPLRLLPEPRIHREAPLGRAGQRGRRRRCPRAVAATAGGAARVGTLSPAVSCPRSTGYNPDGDRGASYGFGAQTVRCAAGPVSFARWGARPGAGEHEHQLLRPSRPEDTGGWVRMTP